MFGSIIKIINYDILLLIKNGFYIPLIGYCVFMYTNHLFLSLTITMKLFPTNFFFWFHHHLKYFPEPYQGFNQLKQFVRFTDTGYLASFICCFYPNFLPLSFNVHSVICIGYWYGKFALNMGDVDLVDNPEYLFWFNNAWTSMNHGLANVLLIREIFISQTEICYDYFTLNDLLYSYGWLYSWFVFIYLPWRYITNDPVYDILGDKLSFLSKLKFIGVIHIIIFMSNIFGYLLHLLSCTASY